MRADIAVGGLGSGVVLIWLWNTVIPAFVSGWPEMPAEVGAAISPALMALIERWVDDR